MAISLIDTLKDKNIISASYAQKILDSHDMNALDDEGLNLIDHIIDGKWENIQEMYDALDALLSTENFNLKPFRTQDRYGKLLEDVYKWNHPLIVKTLLSNPNIDINANNRAALQNAIAFNHKEVIEILLQDNRTEIELSVYNALNSNNKEILTLLMGAKKSDISHLTLSASPFNNFEIQDCTLLMLAVLLPNTECLNILLNARKLNINAQDAFGNTALMLAVQQQNAEKVALLLNSTEKVKLDLLDIHGHSAFYHAKGNPKILDLLYSYQDQHANHNISTAAASAPSDMSHLTQKLSTMLLTTKRTLILGSDNKQFDTQMSGGWSDIALGDLRKSTHYTKNSTGKWVFNIDTAKDRSCFISALLKDTPLSSLPLFKNAPLLNTLIAMSIALKSARVGNCGELSYFAAAQLWRNAGQDIRRIEIASGKDFDHTWVILNRKQGTSLLHPHEWGEDCWIFDPWWGEEGTYYPAAEFHTKMMETMQYLISNFDWINSNTRFHLDTQKAKAAYERYQNALKNNNLEIPLTTDIDIDTHILQYPILQEEFTSVEDHYINLPYTDTDTQSIAPKQYFKEKLDEHKNIFAQCVAELNSLQTYDMPHVVYFNQLSPVPEKTMRDTHLIHILEKNGIIPSSFAQMLVKNHNINAVDEEGRNLLHYITRARWKNPQEVSDTLSVLLKRGYFNINQEDRYGKTALHNAILKENKEAIAVLIENKSLDLNKIDSYNMSYLDHALDQKNITIFKMLLSNNAMDVNTPDKFGHTILHRLIDKGNIPFLTAVLESTMLNPSKRINFTLQDKRGKNLLEYGKASGNPKIIMLLQEFVGSFDLHYLLEIQDITHAQILLEKRTPREPLNKELNFQKIAENHPDFFEYLWKNGWLAIDQTDIHGITLFEVAVEQHFNTILEDLFKYKDLDINANQGAALQSALRHNDKITLDFLLRNEKINIQLPVFYAIFNGNINSISLLLSAKNTDLSKLQFDLTIDGKEIKNITILMFAVALNNLEYVNLILSASEVNINKLNGLGDTALLMAVKNDNVAIVSALLQSPEGIDITIKDNEGNDAFHYALKCSGCDLM